MCTPLLRRWLLALLLVALISPATVAPVRAAACADLAITNFTITPNRPIQDQNAQITVTVKNQGSCKAFGFVVQWKSDRTAPTGPSTQVPGLDAGASTTVNFEYAFPRAGNFLTVVTADTANTVDETNEINNLEILSVSVRPATVDLIIDKFEIDPDPAVQGRVASITITVENQGNTPADSFVVQWKPAPLLPDLSQQVNGLDSGASIKVKFDYTYRAAGEFLSSAEVDSTNRVREADETNNRATRMIKVDPPLPDLTITSFSISPEQPVRGSKATATIEIKNQGHNPARNFIVQWKPTLLTPDLSTQINFLDEGESTTVTFDYTYAIVGDFTSRAEVDSTNRVLELDETNNDKTIPVTVVPATIDLTIVGFSINPAQPTQGANAHVVIRVANQGNSPAGSFIVEWSPGARGLDPRGPSTLSKQVDSLGAGETVDVAFDFAYAESGNFRTIARVDAFNNVPEINEKNNIDLLYVTVRSGIDLVVSLSLPNETIRGSKTTATITVRNLGIYPADAFFVKWQLDQENPAGPVLKIDGLNPGDSKTVTLEATYFKAGTFKSVAIVDFFKQVAESNEDNNTSNVETITVNPRQTKVKVTFTKLHVHSDADDIGTGEWDMNFVVNGEKHPYSNHDADSGHTYPEDPDATLLAPIEVTLIESQPLSIFVNGLDDDSPLGPDQLGFVLKVFGASNNYGAGDHSDKSSCPDGCYTIDYTIEITDPPPALQAFLAGIDLPAADIYLPLVQNPR